MLKGLIFAGFALAATAFGAQAMPIGPSDLGQDSLVTNVAQGCGPGGFRDRWGRCRYGGPVYRGPRVVVRPPVVVAPPRARRCVTRVTPYGVREVCR